MAIINFTSIYAVLIIVVFDTKRIDLLTFYNKSDFSYCL